MGKPHPLSQYRDKVVLVVNTASGCGLTPQLTSLETLNKSISKNYAGDFVILGFPCDQFANQEPKNDEEILSFCTKNHGVTFPIMAKTKVNSTRSGTAEPVWEWMKKEKTFFWLEVVKWNFEKFLIGRDGKVVGRWTPFADPLSLEEAIETELAKGKAGKS
jgi:peroxiredoxin